MTYNKLTFVLRDGVIQQIVILKLIHASEMILVENKQRISEKVKKNVWSQIGFVNGRMDDHMNKSTIKRVNG